MQMVAVLSSMRIQLTAVLCSQLVSTVTSLFPMFPVVILVAPFFVAILFLFFFNFYTTLMLLSIYSYYKILAILPLLYKTKPILYPTVCTIHSPPVCLPPPSLLTYSLYPWVCLLFIIFTSTFKIAHLSDAIQYLSFSA